MTDALRSRIMRANGPRNTTPEVRLRKALHAMGLRYRIADRRLPGSPDLVFARFHCVVFVHGCYWHHHEGCRRATVPKSNTKFWLSKFEANRERDTRDIRMLRDLGWRVGIVWECCELPAVAVEVAEFIRDAEQGFREWPSR
ncbi:MAG: very short patch repair endonuclease [Paracoccaceae bacterium]